MGSPAIRAESALPYRPNRPTPATLGLMANTELPSIPTVRTVDLEAELGQLPADEAAAKRAELAAAVAEARSLELPTE